MEKSAPRIIGFCCNWCAYAGADLAGISRIQYPPNLRMIRLMCSGAVTPFHILEAFQRGAYGVFIGGCHPRDCHYLEGNYKTLRRVLLLKKLLPQLGIEPERLRLEWVSAAEGQRFAEVVTDSVEEINKLGPNPVCQAVADTERQIEKGWDCPSPEPGSSYRNVKAHNQMPRLSLLTSLPPAS